MTSQLNIADQGLHDVIRGGQQLQLVAFYAANALTPFAQLKQRGGYAAVLLGKDVFAGFKVVEPLRGRRPHGAGPLGAAFPQMKLTEREIGNNSYQRQDVDYQKPGHGRGYGSALHQDAQCHTRD